MTEEKVVVEVSWAPTLDRVIVRPFEPEQMTKSGIYLPYVAQEKQAAGEVLAVGPGRYESGFLLETTLRPGDIVMYGKHAGQDMRINGQDLVIIKESDVLAKKV